jgi:putative oxidoreductase
MKNFPKIIAANAPAVVILIRLMVGAVFCAEGIQKFLFPDELGIGRFLKIGIPAPEFMAPVVGIFEIGSGVLVMLGCLTRLAAIPLVTIILVAISTTKMPILLNKGFWNMAHEARTDWCMLLGGIYLIIVGGGRWSIDRYFSSQD